MVKDFIYNEDLETRNGDLFLAESEQSHIKDIVFANKGEYRHSPLVGVAILQVMNGNETIDSIKKRIDLQLRYDNFDVEEIALQSTEDIRIIAKQKVDL